MNALILIFVLAVIVEAVVQNAFADVPARWKPYIALVLSIVLCIAYGADVLGQLGYSANWPFVGSVLTGILISRGANVFNDIVQRIRNPPYALIESVEIDQSPLMAVEADADELARKVSERLRGV